MTSVERQAGTGRIWGMRRTTLALLAWTAVAVVAAVVLGSSVSTPPCAHLVAPPSWCAAEIAAENDRVWGTRTLPLILVLLAGYVVIVLIRVAPSARSLTRHSPTLTETIGP